MHAYFMRSERVGFGIWSPADLELAIALWGDARVTGLIGGPFTKQQVRERLELEISTQESAGFQYWPIFRLRDDVHLGCCGLRRSPGDDALEIGFHLLFEHWGQGYARPRRHARWWTTPSVPSGSRSLWPGIIPRIEFPAGSSSASGFGTYRRSCMRPRDSFILRIDSPVISSPWTKG